MSKNILYIQFTDPGTITPLIHSSRIFSESGWKVHSVGIKEFPGEPFGLGCAENISDTLLWHVSGGVMKKIQYLACILVSLFFMIIRRQDWIYVSNPMAAPIGLLLIRIFKVKTVYHEHDCVFESPHQSSWMKYCLRARNELAGLSEIIILPHQSRIIKWKETLGLDREVKCVPNYVLKSEVAPARHAGTQGSLRLVYCGSLNFNRLPKTILDSMARLEGRVSLSVIGMETVGNRGFLDEFSQHAKDVGVINHVKFLGRMNRSKIFPVMRNHDMGLSFLPTTGEDINESYAEGASNKPFEYMSQGLGVIFSNIPAWKSLFETEGLGMSCNPDSSDELTSLFSFCAENPEKIKEMGEKGRLKVLSSWNYEKVFQPVAEMMV